MMALTEEQTQAVVRMAMDLARQGRAHDLAEMMQRGLDVDVQDADGNSMLMLAAYNGHLDAVRALIALGADVDLPNARGQSPIAGAIFKGEDEVVAELRAAGADLDAGTPSARAIAEMVGKTALLE
ncbi:MAG TPA: ankyrin repeat domain-containing protein [Trueperaceae bacterium]|nr:ankyrin repeat domain-containing protein [Trueperaceae bacterium]